MMIPFLTIVAFSISNEKSIDIDDKIRAIKTSKSVIGIPYLSVKETYFIFEKEIGTINYEMELNDEYFTIDELESITRLKNSANDRVVLELQFPNGKIMQEL